jgi:hypothetical protein
MRTTRITIQAIILVTLLALLTGAAVQSIAATAARAATLPNAFPHMTVSPSYGAPGTPVTIYGKANASSGQTAELFFAYTDKKFAFQTDYVDLGVKIVFIGCSSCAYDISTRVPADAPAGQGSFVVGNPITEFASGNFYVLPSFTPPPTPSPTPAPRPSPSPTPFPPFHFPPFVGGS